LNLPYFLAKRIIFNIRPSFSRFIIRMSVAATAISVAAMVITLCMVNGFQQAVSSKVYSFWGHLRVQSLAPLRSAVSEESNFMDTDSVRQAVQSTPGLHHFHTFALKSVVLRTSGSFEGVLLKGVDEQFAEQPFRFIVQGQNLDFGRPDYSNQVLISRSMAANLNVTLGDTLQCFFVRNQQDIRARPLVICGLFHTGVDEYDQSFALADIRFLRRLNLWDSSQIGGYEIWLHRHSKALAAATLLNDAMPQGLHAASIATLYPNIFDWLAIQDQTKLIVLVIMSIVATINLITCLLILVMERTRMVGVLKAMGMSHQQIQTVFWYYAVWIAVVGTGLGLLLGLGLCVLQQATGLVKMDERTYFVDAVPVQIVWWQITVVVAAALASCLLWLRLPLVVVSRMSAVKAAAFK
jgi:lipoprotein-releasing system permease protein